MDYKQIMLRLASKMFFSAAFLLDHHSDSEVEPELFTILLRDNYSSYHTHAHSHRAEKDVACALWPSFFQLPTLL